MVDETQKERKQNGLSRPSSESNNRKVVDAAGWKKAAVGEEKIVNLPSGVSVKIRRMGILDLCSIGHIPFTMLSEVMKLSNLFQQKPTDNFVAFDEVENDQINQMYELFRKAAITCVVEPKVVEESPSNTEMSVEDIPFEDLVVIFSEGIKVEEEGGREDQQDPIPFSGIEDSQKQSTESPESSDIDPLK